MSAAETTEPMTSGRDMTETQPAAIKVLCRQLGRPVPLDDVALLDFSGAGDLIVKLRAELLGAERKAEQ